jgi:hypothetical protein
LAYSLWWLHDMSDMRTHTHVRTYIRPARPLAHVRMHTRTVAHTRAHTHTHTHTHTDRFLATRWRFVVPFVINQLGSALFMWSLGASDLSLAVRTTKPICQQLTHASMIHNSTVYVASSVQC